MSELISTRDLEETAVDYSTAIVDGLAIHGGLYVSKQYPRLSDAQMYTMARNGYPELQADIKSELIGDDILHNVTPQITAEAYGPENFSQVNDEVVPVERIANTNIFVQNLSLGPTAAFKDQALQVLPREIDYVLEKEDRRLLIVTATSGDTGSAGNAGIKGRSRLFGVTFSPLTGMSEFQRAQMGEQTGDNVINVSVEGRFDDCQDLIKELMEEDKELGAMNSINIGRIFAQVGYYFSGYFQTAQHFGDPIDVVVPTGNFGNVLAGHIARRMGLPIRDLIIATNENDVLHELFETGVYRRREKKNIQVTSSPSMDIGVASNYERLVYELFGNDPKRTAEYMKLFKQLGDVDFKEFRMPPDIIKRHGFKSGSSTEADRIDSIRWVYQQSGTVIDPHTADAITVARRMDNNDVRILCMSTALPVKFEKTIQKALGFTPARPERFEGIEERAAQNPEAFIVIPAELDAVRAVVRAAREKQQAV